MLGTFCSHFMVKLTVLLLTLTSSLSRAQDEISLPEWKSDADYVTQCLNNGQPGTLCDMSVVQLGKVNIIRIGPLSLNGDACLEFWYLSPVLPNRFRITVYLKDNNGVQDIWHKAAQYSREATTWTQAFVPLSNVRPGTEVIFKTLQYPLYRGKKVIVNRIGIRKGSCGAQCDAQTQLWPGESTRCLCAVGQLNCSRVPSSGMCTVHSHTDCSTFDGALFRFMAPCTYTLAKTCSMTPGLPQFSVEVVNGQSDNTSLPSVEQVNVNINNFRMSFLRRQTQRVVVNGVWRTLPLTLASGTVMVNSNPAAVVLKSSFGLFVSFDYTGALHVTLPSRYSDKVCGLCGNYNHNKWDDLQRRDGTETQNTTDLVDSWQTGGNASACEAILVPHYCDPLEEREYASEAYCGALGSDTGPFAACQEVLGAESYFRGCMTGMCASHGDPAVLCDTLHMYADLCKKAGVDVPSWRNSSFCSLQCGENSHYNSCAEGCPDVCSPLDQVSSCDSCEERCECDPGFKLSSGKCVQAEDCGCWHNRQHYEKGATFMKGECNQQCVCVGNNNIQCRSSHCSASEICSVQNGVKGCYAFSPATCSVYGDPHYITFDGFAYDFNGGCSYILTTTCGSHGSVDFTVIGHNMHPPHNNFTNSKLVAVTLKVQDLNITINVHGHVHEHNSQVLLPYFTTGKYGHVRVYVDSGYTVLETSFGLRMMMDRQNRLFLQVNEHYKYELCGLCGTYSDRQDDDLVTPGGQNATSAFEFGDSWRIQDSNWCVSHPNDSRQCNSHELEEAYNQCYTLLGEGFRLCHETIHPEIYISSCVRDYCAEPGNLITLCESLKSYAAACAVAGVKLGQWQDGTVCAVLQTTVNPMTTSTALPAPDQTLCPLNCDFEKNLCGWEQLVQDSFDWTRHSGATPSSQTGPSNDHTSGDGSYMYIEGNSVTHGDSARMFSSMCQYGRPMCLHLWYHMYGSATAMAFNIYLIQDNRATKVWSKQNNQGSEWKLGQVDITPTGPYQIILEGIRGSTIESDVAFDDISIHFGSCSESFPDVISGTKLPQITITTQVIPTQVCNLGCNFDQSLCDWNQMVTDAFDWTWHSSSTPTLMTGPSADHTGGGHYLYIEASSVSYGDTARLMSSECSNSGAQCLQFWYHMYGSAETMGLHVYVVEGRNARSVWRQRNDQGNMWHLAQVDITTTGPFQIIFEGRRGSNDQSDVALDDVSLHHGPCSDMNNPSTSRPATSAGHISTTSKPQTTTVNSSEPLTTKHPEHQSTTVWTTAEQQPPTTEEQTAPSEGPWPPTTNATTTAPETDGPQPTNPEDLDTTPAQPTSASLTVEPTRPTEGKTTEQPQPPTMDFTDQTTAIHDQTTPETSDLHTTVVADQSTGGSIQTTANTEWPTPSEAPQPTSPEDFETTQATITGLPLETTIPNEGVSTANPEPSVTSERPQQTTPGPNQGSTVPSAQPTTVARPETTTTTRTTTTTTTTLGTMEPQETAAPTRPPTDGSTAAPATLTTTAAHTVESQTTSAQTQTTTTARTTTITTPLPETPSPTPSCPTNSHYSSCVSACTPTCHHLYGPPGCSESDCVEGCVCDEGYVLKQRVCVPIRGCGCMDLNGKKYSFGDDWYSSHCTEKCKCEKRRGVGRIECEEQEECKGKAVCLQNNNGDYNCEKTGFSDCSINGDPEYRTFDHQKHDFEGEHSYVLVQTSNLPNNLQSVYIEGINGHSEDDDDSSEESRQACDDDDEDDDESSEEDSEDKEDVLRELKIRVYNYTVVFKPRRRLVVDGRRVDTPLSLSPGLKIRECPSRIYLQTDFGLSVEFDGHSKAEIILPYVYKRKVGGLCGNFDGNKRNDFMKPDGTQATSVQEFGESWRV